jgi:hypothetical protein
MEAPPSLVTLPPHNAVVSVIELAADVETTGNPGRIQRTEKPNALLSEERPL